MAIIKRIRTTQLLSFCLQLYLKSRMLLLANCLRFSTRVVKQRVERPLPNFVQYYLVDQQNRYVSPWADVDLALQGDILTAIIEIPKDLSAKLQMIKEIPNHPLMQDIRTNKFNNLVQLRHYALPLPLVNYGYLPQTWEQNIRPDIGGYYGDNDPIDILDLSQRQRKIMDVSSLKVLGSFCLIDQGQLDWKVIGMDPQQARAKKIETIEDVPAARLNQIMNWFKIYKTYDGKPANTVGFDEKIFDKQQTLQIIYDTHVEFIKLKQGKTQEYQERKEEFNL